MPDKYAIAVVGAGTMGSGIAHVFARSGFQVSLCDVEQRFLDRALASIRTNLGREAAKGKLPEPKSSRPSARIRTTVRSRIRSPAQTSPLKPPPNASI